MAEKYEIKKSISQELPHKFWSPEKTKRLTEGSSKFGRNDIKYHILDFEENVALKMQDNTRTKLKTSWMRDECCPLHLSLPLSPA